MPRRPDLPCASCGRLMWRGKGVLPAGKARCRQCRAAEQKKHGTATRYKAGCRCADCREAKRVEMAEYVAMVRERDGVTPTQKIRPRSTEIRPCAVCSEPVTGKIASNRPMHNACRPSKFWANAIQISDRDRLAIYERDGWICQLCNEPVDRSLNYQDRWAATLDHVMPRSLTLFSDDSPENLRLAHRACNSARGNRVA